MSEQISALLQDEFQAVLSDFITLVAPSQKTALVDKLIAARGSGVLLTMVHGIDKLMTAPFDEATYAKPFKRITGKMLTLYDVVVYKDIRAIVGSAAGRRAMGVGQFYELEDMAELQDEKATSDILLRLCQAVRALCALSLPDVPSRDDITANIAANRAQRKALAETPATTSAVPASGVDVDSARRESVCQAIRAVGGAADKLDAALLARMDSKFGEDKAFADALETKNHKAVAANAILTELMLPAPSDSNAKAWDELCTCMHRAHTLAEMTKAIPPSMMATIERQASALAGGVQSGSIDMSSLDLGKIGENVMSSTSADDMQHLAANMDTLLPNLNALTKSMQNDPSGPSLPPDVQAMLKSVSSG